MAARHRTTLLRMDVRLVTDQSDLGAALELVAEPVVGIDVERADGERYFKVAALVQVGTAGRCVLVDGIAVDDLGSLAGFLAGRLAVFHALENDLGPLATLGVNPTRLADTSIAAALLGLPTGLRPLLTEAVGVRLSSDKERLQRADWSLRPLSPEMIAYAGEDVAHLATLWAELERRLQAAGRRDWYEQELRAVVERVGDQRRCWTRTRGVARLDERGRAVVRALWEERETIARHEDMAPQLIVRDECLVAIAEDPPRTVAALVERGLRGRQARRYGRRLLAAVGRGMGAEHAPDLGGSRLSTREDRAAHDRLRRARAQVAGRLGLSSGVLCPSRLLWRAVLADPRDGTELCAAAGLRPWQTQLLGEALWAAYTNDDAGVAEVHRSRQRRTS
ncbi:MAG: HRDC domain-containing protein [Actinomycetota bacterium]|nr:HRDC domain-containing protein [Actinomycetota bacterium]